MAETIIGLRELGRKLDHLEAALRGKALRSAVVQGSLPGRKAAKAAAPVASPPYGPYLRKDGSVKQPFDPYPQRTYKGGTRFPGFTSRNIRYKSYLSVDKRSATVRWGVRGEAFYAVMFQELGTSQQAREPWLEPSFLASKGQVLKRFSERSKVLIERAARKK